MTEKMELADMYYSYYKHVLTKITGERKCKEGRKKYILKVSESTSEDEKYSILCKNFTE